MPKDKKPVDLAWEYMDCFFGQSTLEAMKPLLADDLEFDGPLQRYFTARSYLEALESDPPSDVRYEIEEVYESGHSVCFIYQYFRPGIATRMAQTFEVRGGKIRRIRLVFDARAFT